MFVKNSLLGLSLAAHLTFVNGKCQKTATNSPAQTCQLFSQEHPDLTFYSNATTYTTLNEGMSSAPSSTCSAISHFPFSTPHDPLRRLPCIRDTLKYHVSRLTFVSPIWQTTSAPKNGSDPPASSRPRRRISCPTPSRPSWRPVFLLLFAAAATCPSPGRPTSMRRASSCPAPASPS
jgi:hypothetical protein